VPALVNPGDGVYASFAPATATPSPTVSAPEKAKAKDSGKATDKSSSTS
jgi:hypothetical protein